VISPSQRPLPDSRRQSQETDNHVPGGIRTHKLRSRAAADLSLRPRGYWHRLLAVTTSSLHSYSVAHRTRGQKWLFFAARSTHPCFQNAVFLPAFWVLCHITQPTAFKQRKSKAFSPLTPNDPYSGRTAPLTSKRFILYIYSTNICTKYFKHGIYCPFFSLQNAVCFIILTYFVPVLFTFYIQSVLKLKKSSGAKRLTLWRLTTHIMVVPHR